MEGKLREPDQDVTAQGSSVLKLKTYWSLLALPPYGLFRLFIAPLSGIIMSYFKCKK